MADTLTTIESKVRYLLDDNLETRQPGEIFVYGSSSVFTLGESNVEAVSSVLVNDVVTAQYTFNSTTNKVTISKSMVVGDIVEIIYTYYSNYSSTEITNFIKASLVHLSVNNYTPYDIVGTTVYPEPTRADKNLIALITKTIIKPDNASYSLPDIKITVPKDLPVEEKIRMLISKAKMGSFGVFDIVPTEKYV